ncbi:immediate early response 3-interacting protein 1 [Anopheles merus]|uniref:Immediate early response 3-interacting protein 1 n=4 Tax=gambiae species complex TaxID=44542 RepID=A0A453YZF5_ANOGA|nr:immediate early response 3-interacting protein 1 [Anopheles coluzzii]XP_041770123.1 immediate early response 3-interacting protein 1 [Anopheles merus]
MFTLWSLVEASLLFLNAVCVLSEERFLSKYGWGMSAQVQGFGEPASTKAQILLLVRSIRTVAKIPLIFLNIVAIMFKLILG